VVLARNDDDDDDVMILSGVTTAYLIYLVMSVCCGQYFS